MKPLELTVYPLDESFPLGYVLPRDSRVTFHSAIRAAESKRFTDAELAAEYWRADGDESMICEGYLWMNMCGGWRAAELDASQRASALKRFATLPHYDKATP